MFFDELKNFQPPKPNLKQMRIDGLKRKLSNTDYKAIKFAEGWITADDYAPIKAERQAIRDQINALEAELAAGENNGGV